MPGDSATDRATDDATDPVTEPATDPVTDPVTDAATVSLKTSSSRGPIVQEPFRGPETAAPTPGGTCLQLLLFAVSLYAFFVSIDLMSASFKLMGGGFAQHVLTVASDPLAALFMGVLATSLVQSSSSISSIVVGLVAAGAIPLELAIPMIMGANIGTTVTNTIVSMGHLTRRGEFERAFAAATVHDFFNVLAVLVLFPIEVLFHPIQQCATLLSSALFGFAGVSMMSPLKVAVRPVTGLLETILPYGLPLLGLALAMLFVALSQMVRVMRQLVLTRIEGLFDRVLFRNDAAGFVLGWLLTSAVQSSSATTSLVVPLVGSGVLSVRRVFTYTLGANLGTTVTALLASFATGCEIGLTVAFAHMIFNIFGTIIFYPLRALPIGLATLVGRTAARSKRHTIYVLAGYIVLYTIPIFYVFIH